MNLINLNFKLRKRIVDGVSVVEAAAFAMPCNHYGEKIEAGVVLNKEKSLKENDLISHCKKFLGDFKSPSKIHFFNKLPKGPSGKIQMLKIKKLN